jgi:hypothetical protein
MNAVSEDPLGPQSRILYKKTWQKFLKEQNRTST